MIMVKLKNKGEILETKKMRKDKKEIKKECVFL